MSELVDTRSPRGAYADDLICPDCGYPLRGLTSERCPECGLLLDFIESGESGIPWCHRKRIGRVRAFCKTVFMEIFRNRMLCREIYRPVSYADAQRFRWVCVAVAYVSTLIGVGLIHVEFPNLLGRAADEVGWWFITLVAACYLLALVAFTGLPSYFFHPRRLSVATQNRAVALSYYASAPLTLMVLPVLVIAIGGPLLRSGVLGFNSSEASWILSAAMYVGIFGLCWIDVFCIAWKTLRRTARVWLIELALPVVTVVTCALILVGLPLIAFFFGLIVYSL